MTVSDDFHVWRWRLVLGWIVVFTILVAAAIKLSYDASQENHRVICAQKAFLTHQRDTSIAYLREHPDGVVSRRTGEVLITATEIQDGIDQDSLQLKALRGVECS